MYKFQIIPKRILFWPLYKKCNVKLSLILKLEYAWLEIAVHMANISARSPNKNRCLFCTSQRIFTIGLLVGT